MLKRLVFRPNGRRLVEKELLDHPGRFIALACIGIVYKMDLLDDDFRDLKLKVACFWDQAFRPDTMHSSFCQLQRDVWRAAFHVATSSQSLSETILSTMQEFSERRKQNGRKMRDYWISNSEWKWNKLINSSIYKFNGCLRGALYHARLSNPVWAGYMDFVKGRQRKRFLLDFNDLIRFTNRDPAATAYVKRYSVTVRGFRKRRKAEPFGVDLLLHFQRYRKDLRGIGTWVLGQLQDPHFATDRGFAAHSLEEYLDWERASKGVSRRWKRCRHCGYWVSS